MHFQCDGFRLVSLGALNIVAASLLVNTNKVLLVSSAVPAPSSALTFCHYLITLITLRLQCFGIGEHLQHVPRFRVFLIMSAATLGVASSNIALKQSSVSFHQVSRLLTLPGGLLFDYFLYKKVRTIAEVSCIFIVAFGIYEVVSSRWHRNFGKHLLCYYLRLLNIGHYRCNQKNLLR